MANEYYITAGLPAIDSADIGSVGTNAYYLTAGLVADDYAAAPAGTIVPILMRQYRKKKTFG